jgi:hypothetical protein
VVTGVGMVVTAAADAGALMVVVVVGDRLVVDGLS